MILSAIFFKSFESEIIPDKILFTTGVNVSGFLYTLSDTALFRASTIASYIGLFFLKSQRLSVTNYNYLEIENIFAIKTNTYNYRT